MGVTLRQNQRDYYYEELTKLFPEEKLPKRYMDTYGNKYECPSPNSKKLWEVFTYECKKYGLSYKMKDIISGYKDKYEKQQISWF